MLNIKLPSDSRSRVPFARKAPFRDQELTGLFELFDRLPPSDARATLSQIARERLRLSFPQSTAGTGVVELVNGLSVEVDLSDLFGAEFYVGHCNEASLISALCATIPQGARIVDVGANFGLYALHAAHAAGKDAQVVAFEPAPKAFDLLVSNINRNDLTSQIRTRRAAVSGIEGEATFHVAKDESFSGLRDTGRSPVSRTITVPQVSLDTDEHIAALGLIDFMKIDTEGGESQVLIGAKQLIKRSSNLVLMMEYSVKNLTSVQMKEVENLVGEFMHDGMKVWAIGPANDVASISSFGRLPKSFNGSLIVAAKAATWVEDFLAAITSSSNHQLYPERTVIAAAHVLLSHLRSAQENLTLLERLGTREEVAGEGSISERLVKYVEHLEARASTLQANSVLSRDQVAKLCEKLKEADAECVAVRGQVAELNEKLKSADAKAVAVEEKFCAERRELHSQLSDKSASLDLLNEKVARLRGHISALNENVERGAVERKERQAWFAARELDVAAERGQLIAARDEGVEAILALERAAGDAADLLENRRSMIRKLQQQVALLNLGRIKQGKREGI